MAELFKCSGPCGQEKPREAFYPCSSSKNKIQSKCKECEKLIASERRSTDKWPESELLADRQLINSIESLWKPTNA